jgi:transmembrane sensor
MNISQFAVEDFVYNPSFRKWVLQPDLDSSRQWESLLLKYPFQKAKVIQARKILLTMESEVDELSQNELSQIWANIDAKIDAPAAESKIIPLRPSVKVEKPQEKKHGRWRGIQLYRIAAILIVSFGLGMVAATMLHQPVTTKEPKPVVFEEHTTPPGVKSYLTLSDGSKVVLNSGSSIKYVKGFTADRREIYLEGEAFFDVYKDVTRPFIVRKSGISITALGTSFNVEGYSAAHLNISLVSGKVGIDLAPQDQQYVFLEKGESLLVKPLEGTWAKSLFNEEEVLAWTKKTIIFNKTPVLEAVRILENWYGISFIMENQPSPKLLLSGRFEDETLENVLKGLSYTTDLTFRVQNDVVNIKF